jgi:mono/diheme cytochrome c family protein
MVITPWFNGTHAWHPMSYNPNTGLVYVPIEHRNYGFVATRSDDNPMGMRLSISMVEGPKLHDALGMPQIHETYLLAWDPVQQREVFRVPHGRALSGGTVTTATNLVFQGNRNDNSFKAFAAENGELLWSYDVQTGALAGPVTFRVDGEQYVAVVGGYRSTRSYYEPNGSRLFVFKLGGTAQLPPLVEVPEPVLAPPENFGTTAQLATGEAQYDTYCVVCHGVDGQARVFYPDLRYSPALASQELFDSIVLQGVRSDKGMVSFAQALTQEHTAALRAYLTAQANELKAARAN